jgi:hypothetical protein
MEFDDDISQGLAAELTGSTGFSDDDLNAEGGMVPADLADDIEDYDDQALRRDAHLQSDDEAVQAEALQQERQQLDLQAQQLEAQRQQMAAVQQQQLAMQRIALEQQRQAALEAQIPAFEEDPEGHVAAKFRLQELRAQEAAQAEQYRVQYQQQTAEFARHAAEVAPVVGGIEAEYIAEHLNGDESAYRGAFDFVFAHADAQIRVQHPGMDEAGYNTLRSVAAMAFLKNCADQNINPAQYVHARALELGYRAHGRVPGQQQRQPATMAQMANMNPKQPRNGAQPDVDRMDDATFNEMFESMKQSSAGNRFGFGD